MEKQVIETLLDSVVWERIENCGVYDPFHPIATHMGILAVGDYKLRVYRLSDGRRVIDASDLDYFFNRPEEP